MMEYHGPLYYLAKMFEDFFGIVAAFLLASWWIYFILRKAIAHGIKESQMSDEELLGTCTYKDLSNEEKQEYKDIIDCK